MQKKRKVISKITIKFNETTNEKQSSKFLNHAINTK